MAYAEKNNLFPASSEQAQSWKYHKRLTNDDAHQIITEEIDVGTLDMPVLEKAVEALYERHESLRTRFVEVDGQVMQQVIDTNMLHFECLYYDLCHQPANIGAITDAVRKQLTALDQAPLMKICVIKLPDLYKVFIIVHHIISDVWSLSVIVNELTAIYQSLLNATTIDLPAMPMQLKDYAIWQKRYLEKEGDSIRRYWRKKLDHLFGRYYNDESKVLLKQLDAYKGYSYRVCYEEDVYRQLVNAGKTYRVSLSTILCAAFHLVLHWLHNKPRSVIAMSITNRYKPEMKNIIGAMGGGIYLVNEAEKSTTVDKFIQVVNKDLFRSLENLIFDHDEMGLGDLPLRLNTDIYVNYISTDFLGPYPMPRAGDGIHRLLDAPVYYPFACYIREYTDGLCLEWNYNALHYPVEKVEQCASMYSRVTELICANHDLHIDELLLTSNTEK